MTAPLKADVTAAERLLKAAVRRAVEILREPGRMRFEPSVPNFTAGGPLPYAVSATSVTGVFAKPTAADVEAMLRAAGESAELLLSERAPKRAAS